MPGVVAIGDVFVDLVCDITPAALSIGPADELDHTAPLVTAVGGGGLQFALAAVESGFSPVCSIATVGVDATGRRDPAGVEAAHVAARSRIRTLWAIDHEQGTGRTFIVYGAAGQRLMISDPAANRRFSTKQISSEMREAVEEAGLVYISGYALTTEPRRSATLELMRQAKSAGAVVAVDLAPHTIYQIVDARLLLKSLKGLADWLIASSSTARGIVGHSDDTSVVAVASELALWSPTVAVFETPGEALVMSGGASRLWHCDYQDGQASRGHSARAQASLLAEYLG